MSEECKRLKSASQRASGRRWTGFLLSLLIAGPGLVAVSGCAAEDKKPKTVTEFLKQPRVGEMQN